MILLVYNFIKFHKLVILKFYLIKIIIKELGNYSLLPVYQKHVCL